MNSFHIVDVFAERRYAGNQLAVFVAAQPLDAAEMQAIARETGFSETTFVNPRPAADGGFSVRIFTPGREVPFAGHPSLGTAHVIRELGLVGPGEGTLILNLAAGRVPVEYVPDGAGDTRPGENRGVYWMTHPEPEFGPAVDRAALAEVLGIAPADIVEDREPLQVSTGLPHIIVPLVSLRALSRIKVSRERYFALIEQTWAKNILAFAPEPHETGNDISIRMFADYLGIPEDPATGSGNGCLLAYLARTRYWGRPEVSIRSEQGYEMGRPSLLHGRAHDRGGHIDVRVGGAVVNVAKGVWGG